MKRLLSFFNFSIKEKVSALSTKETYFAFISGSLLISGLIVPAFNFLFYFGFIYPVVLIYKRKFSKNNFFFWVLPYFLVLGFGTWNYIFPYYTGVLLSIGLADLFSKIIYFGLIRINSTTVKLIMFPLYISFYDFLFQETPYLQKIEMIPLLSSIYNHLIILKLSSVIGSHLTLFLIILFIALIMIQILERRISKKYLTSLLVVVILFSSINNTRIYGTNEEISNEINISVIQGVFQTGQKFNSYEEFYNDKLDWFYQLSNNTNSDIIVFPETIVGVYDTSNKLDLSFRKKMTNFAKVNNTLVLHTVTEINSEAEAKENTHITSLLVSGEGILGKSSKRNLVPFKETDKYSKGTDFSTVKTNLGDIGISICYDTNYGTIEKLKGNNAQLIVAPFNDFGFGPIYHNIHRYYPIIKAIENNIPIAVANYDGVSQIINSNGEIIQELGYGEIGKINTSLKLSSKKSIYLLFGRYMQFSFFFLAFILFIYIRNYELSKKDVIPQAFLK